MEFNMRNSYIRPYEDPKWSHFKSDSDRVANNFETEAYVNENGIVRWKSNNSVPPSDILEFWAYLKKPFNYKESVKTSEKETVEFFANYRKARANEEPSSEELFEMRANFEKGTTVINLGTGRRTKI